MAESYQFSVVLPEPGQLADKLVSAGVKVDYVRNESWRWWVYTLKSKVKYFLTFPVQIISLIRWIYFLRNKSIDLIHCNTNRIVEPIIASKILKIPCLLHFRDIPSRMRYKFVFGWHCYYKIANLADRWIAISNAVKDDISPFGKVPLQLIHNGLDIEEFDRLSTKECELNVPSDKIKIAMLGGINPWKKQKEFVEVAVHILKGREDIIFYIVGAPVVSLYYQELIDFSCDAGCIQNIQFTGHVKNTASFLSQNDILLHTTPHEPFGRVFIEAMAAKVPVIAYNSGGAKDIVKHDETGLLVELGSIKAMVNAVITLAVDIDLREKMGEAGRKRVEKYFNIERHCYQISTIYSDTLNINN